MYLDGLDAIDQKIVEMLTKNARASYSEIGEQTGISRVAVRARVQALEARGIIEEYTAIVNPQKIGGAVSCYFEIETTPDTLAQVIKILSEHPSVTQIYRVTGPAKLHVHAVCACAAQMEQLISETIDTLPGATRCACNIILSRIKDVKGLRL